MLLARWVDVGVCEVMLNRSTGVNVFESGNIGGSIIVHLDHFPAEVDFDTALLALLEGHFVGIGESVDELIGCPVLNFASL